MVRTEGRYSLNLFRIFGLKESDGRMISGTLMALKSRNVQTDTIAFKGLR